MIIILIMTINPVGVKLICQHFFFIIIKCNKAKHTTDKVRLWICNTFLTFNKYTCKLMMSNNFNNKYSKYFSISIFYEIKIYN